MNNLTPSQTVALGIMCLFGIPICVGLIVAYLTDFWTGILVTVALISLIAFMAHGWWEIMVEAGPSSAAIYPASSVEIRLGRRPGNSRESTRPGGGSPRLAGNSLHRIFRTGRSPRVRTRWASGPPAR